MVHLVHVGGRKSPGDIVTIDMEEHYFDEAAIDPHVHLNVTVPNEAMTEIHLAVRIPRGKVAAAKPEAQIIRDPHTSNVPLENMPLPITSDGWVSEDFTELEVGVQYGIFFPGLNLYK